MQLSRLRPLNLSFYIFLLQIRRSLRLSVCAFYIRVEALYTLKHHPAESVTSDFFIADPNNIHDFASSYAFLSHGDLRIRRFSMQLVCLPMGFDHSKFQPRCVSHYPAAGSCETRSSSP